MLLVADRTPLTTVPREVELRTLADVESLLARVRAFRPIPRASVAVATLASREAREVETRLHMYAAECGCGTGSVVASLTLVGYVAYLAGTAGWPTSWRLSDFGVGLVVCVAASVVGKAVGLLRARVRMTRELSALRRHLQTVAAHGG